MVIQSNYYPHNFNIHNNLLYLRFKDYSKKQKNRFHPFWEFSTKRIITI